ncbi:hypothetical protein HYU06_00910 [Candidatus Woesearchaeota archaeon]|nr:hypothetical protein [Candidatus Woesearchaeota archaeon]
MLKSIKTRIDNLLKKEGIREDDNYALKVISIPEELTPKNEKYLPDEIKYILKETPHNREKLIQVIEEGKAIGVRIFERTPDALLKAVSDISINSQHFCITTWLPQLLKEGKKPIFTENDYNHAKAHKVDLDKDLNTILRYKTKFKQVVLIDINNSGITKHEQDFVAHLNEILYQLAVDYIIFRIISDNAHERTAIAQNIIKAMLFVGPIAHILEKYSHGFGKIFAASADDLLGESAELMALRGSGFSWRFLLKRLKILVPVFILATYGAYKVEHFFVSGHIIFAGILFGLSSVALSLTTAILSISMYYHSVETLIKERKLKPHTRWEKVIEALRQDFTNPARLGLLIGSSLAPITGIIAAVSGLMYNGWVLAAVGSTESIGAGLTIILWNKISHWRYHRRLEREFIRKKRA